MFGRNGDLTTDVEADESQFQSWSTLDEASGARTYYWYVWLGIIQRGNPANFHLCSLGVTVSHNEPRVPPLSATAWRDTCSKLFDSQSNVVLMTDSAQSYAAVDAAGIVEKHAVNHTEHEFSRSVSVLSNVVTADRRSGMAGTQLIDREWGHIKEMLPDSLSARTEEGRLQFSEHIREAQWKRLMHTSDRWQRFCLAAKDYTLTRGLMTGRLCLMSAEIPARSCQAGATGGVCYGCCMSHRHTQPHTHTPSAGFQNRTHSALQVF